MVVDDGDLVDSVVVAYAGAGIGADAVAAAPVDIDICFGLYYSYNDLNRNAFHLNRCHAFYHEM